MSVRRLRAHGSVADYAPLYVKYIVDVLGRLDWSAVGRVADIFDTARKTGRTVFFVGNGGSAATASHFANDLSFGAQVDGEPPFVAMSLTDNAAVLTALANDRGYEKVFVDQLRNLFRPGDVLVAISASGNSPNLLEAVEYANGHAGTTVGLVGFDGGKMKERCHACIHVATPAGDYGPVETIHLLLDHLLTDYFQAHMRREPRGELGAR